MDKDSAHTAYVEVLAQGVEAWTAQGILLALTGGYDSRQNQPMLREWQHHPIRDVGEFWRQVKTVPFETRGIAQIHGADFGSFSLDMDGEQGRSDFRWLERNGYIRSGDFIVDSPGGFHATTLHAPRLLEGSFRHPRTDSGTADRRTIIIPGFDGPRGDGTLVATPRGRMGANVTKLPPTIRPITGERYIARTGWMFDPLPLWDWLRVEPHHEHIGEPVVITGEGTSYARAALVGETQSVMDATDGSRNDQLFDSARKLGQLIAVELLDEGFVTKALVRASELNEYIADEGIRPTLTTIASGIEKGYANPRSVR